MNTLIRSWDVQDAVNNLSIANDKERGAIFTKKEVVEFILDLTNYTENKSLYTQRLLEPSFGNGDFLLIAIERLLKSYSYEKETNHPILDLKDSVRAVELHKDTFNEVRAKVIRLLEQYNITTVDAIKLSSYWLINDDFLLSEFPYNFTHIVGNPPYIRQEMIQVSLIKEYRKRYKTIYDRADLYIPFIEKSLNLLDQKGKLSFICSDRWMKNRYGGPLRELVSNSFHLKFYINMVGLPAFHSEVSAYAAVTVITKEKGLVTRVVHKPEISRISLNGLVTKLLNEDIVDPQIKEISAVTKGSNPWLLNGSDESDLIKKLEEKYPVIEAEGCKVGIGVATGCDNIYIGPFNKLPVEEDRKLPLVTTSDIIEGYIQWSGKGIINPFDDDGTLVELNSYPKLEMYFEQNSARLLQRNVAKRNSKSWYRTIDKITKKLTYTPKLLIPDIKMFPNVVLDEGKYYPHHNLYYVTSSDWNIKALQAVLRSSMMRFFVAVYSVKMRGNYLRFQAQYIRRVRIPKWDSLSEESRQKLEILSNNRDIDKIDMEVFKLYNLTYEEIAIVKDTLNKL